MRLSAAAKEISIAGSGASVEAKEKSRGRRRWVAITLGSFFVSAVTGLAGIAIGAASFFHFIGTESGLRMFGPVMNAMTFASLILGAHCLDRIDALDHSARVSKLKEKLHIDKV